MAGRIRAASATGIPRPGSPRLPRVLLAVSALLALQGCMTAGQLGLLTATDLSDLRPGMTRMDVHELLGDPDEPETAPDDDTERFTIDRGYENPRVKENPALRPIAVVLSATLDYVTLGWWSACTLTCQAGWLDARYDRCGYLVVVRQQSANDGGPCWRGNAGRGCEAIARSHKPSSLQHDRFKVPFHTDDAISQRCLSEEPALRPRGMRGDAEGRSNQAARPPVPDGPGRLSGREAR